tara:strand:+ start:7022 stop:7672 length:651 start_codon:yes stop_codon:yes gene_type:complete
MKALFFGSIGTVIETSEIQRQSFNKAFKDAGLNWYWNIATYCNLLNNPGGKKRIKEYSQDILDQETIDFIHSKKEQNFSKFLLKKQSPRRGIKNIYDLCLKNNIKLCLITTTSLNNINSIKNTLSESIDFSKLSLITSLDDIKKPKPNSEIYSYALKKLNLKAEEVYAIEDTISNKYAALNVGIKCYLYPGEYAMVNSNEDPIYEIEKKISSLIKN